MASKAHVSLSAPPSMAPEKPSFSGSLFIRAPLTLDDSEFDASSNGTCIDSGSESGGFVSGDEFEMASTRPLVVDPEADLRGNACEEEEGSAEVDISLRVMPFAQLSGYDDDEEEGVVHEVEGDEIFGVVRVPSIDMSENFVGFPRIRAWDVDEEELETLMSRDSSTVSQSFIANELTVANHMSSDNFIEQLSIDMPENSVGLPRIKALDVEEELETLMLRDCSTFNHYFIADELTVANHMSSDNFIEQLSIDMPENFVGLPRIKALDVEEEELETLMLRDSSTVEQSFIASELMIANHMSSYNFIDHDNFDMPEHFIGLPKIKALNVKEEELETLMLRDSSTVNQSFNAKDLIFVDHMSSDNFIEDENGVESFRTDKRLVEVEHNQTLDEIVEDRVAQEEYLIATDTDIMLQDLQTSLNTEQLSKVKIASDELDNEEGFDLDVMDRLEGDTINMIETGAVSMKSITQRKLEVDTKETTEMVEATSVMIGDSSLLKSDVEDHNKSKMLKMNTSAHDLQKQNPQTQVDFSQTGELEPDAFAKGIECTGREPIFCLPTQEAAANGGQGFNLDIECENEKLISINKSVINSKVNLNDASASFESSDDHACEGKNIPTVESAKFSDAGLLQQTVYLENDLEDELFSDCRSQELVETGLNLGETVKRESTVDLHAVSQELKRAGSAPNGDAEGLISPGHEQFMEQISALSILLGSKGSSNKNSQQEEADRSSHEELNLLKDNAKEHLLYAIDSDELNCSRITITSADEFCAFSVKDPASLSSLLDFEGQAGFKHNVRDKEKEKVEKIQATSVKFLRLVQRINLSLKDPFVLKVLCRLVADIGRRSNQEFVIESAKFLAKKLEEKCDDDLDFSLNILVLGKSGVGKSATINSVFGETKVMTSAFEPATTSVKVVTGTVQGVKIRILDTPGLRSPMKEQDFNRKILSSIKRYMKKFPLDVILYVDRVDSQTRDLNDMPLLRSITGSLGPSIWQRAILTLTHAASTPWDDPSGFPLSFEVFVAQKSNLVQQLISQAAGDVCQENPSFTCPVSLVENHPLRRKNKDGECVLPNALGWRRQLLALCISLKILCEVSSMARPQTYLDQWKHFFFQNRSSPLGHPLSSLMQSHAHLKLSANWS